jgi:hypothetical protein
MHFRQQGFRGYILLVGPSDRTKKNTNPIEIMHIPKLTENAVVEIRLQIE